MYKYSQKINILVLTSLFPIPENPVKGIFVYNMLKALKEKVRFTIVVPVPYLFLSFKSNNKEIRENFKKKLIDTLSNVDDIIYIDYPFLPRAFHPFFSIFLYYKLKIIFSQLIEKRKFDLLHSHFLFPEGVISAKLGKDFSMKSICTVHGTDLYIIAHRFYWKPFLLYALNNLDGLIFVSKTLMERFSTKILKGKKYKNLNLAVIPNGFADWVIPSPDRTDEQLLRKLRKQKKKIILFVGNLIKIKRPDIAVEALAYIRKNGYNAVLIIIGKGPKEAEITSKATGLNLREGKDLILMGRVSHERVLFWMKEADVLILTSESEGMSSVVLESLSVGSPVVTTAVGICSEVIVNGVNGFLVQKGDPVNVAEHLMKALSCSWDREKIKASVKNYSWTQLSEQFISFYMRLINDENNLYIQ